ncbi:hypothetical protein [Sorangium cellulosum]|uniref:Uncharacterized protein n=1 Tax=Sorangium cellulosum So0157-2 TaxID=1254432 RepID=S4Y086_SORCE|nr:hypothetical protein [Sorangium cellulosum]AGP38164.1 hypothetical protein SCE1572_29040 [Sorangium cellulosum So0157-2]
MMPEGSEPVCTGVAVAEALAAQHLERDAEGSLDAALALATTLHAPGQRERYRLLLERAIAQAERALAAAAEERAAPEGQELAAGGERTLAAGMGARSTLARAHAARAEDALHGAGQLSLSAQRAPTREACDDGWRRVEAIVTGAEAAARAAASCAAELEAGAPRSKAARAARAAAHRAEVAAGAARRIVEERNHAYTFHTDNGFSFGEGWHVAAAAVLAGAAVQIEPGKAGTPQAEAFLRDAGLSDRLQAYRSRPRAMKQTTEIVARAFSADPSSAQRRLRAAFLGDAPIPEAVAGWVDRRLADSRAGEPRRKKVLLWIRACVHHPHRNTTLAELLELTDLVRRAGLVPVLTGDALRDGRVPEGAVDMTLFWKDPTFRQLDMRRAQLQFFEHLKRAHGLAGQVGVTTAGMDGPALMGIPTMYLTDAPNVRMRAWVGAVPGYQEVVRESDYLERVRRGLSEWAAAP